MLHLPHHKEAEINIHTKQELKNAANVATKWLVNALIHNHNAHESYHTKENVHYSFPTTQPLRVARLLSKVQEQLGRGDTTSYACFPQRQRRSLSVKGGAVLPCDQTKLLDPPSLPLDSYIPFLCHLSPIK